MPFLRDRGIGFTISAAFAATLFLMAVLVGITLHEIEQTQHARQVLTDDVIPAIDRAVDIEHGALRLSDLLLLFITSGSPADRRLIEVTDGNLQKAVVALRYYHHSGGDVAYVEALGHAVGRLRSTVAEAIDRAETSGSAIALYYYRGNVPQLISPILDAAGGLETAKRGRVKVIRDSLAARGERLSLFLLVGFIGAAVLCIFVARATIAMVTVPARRLVIAARSMETGSYDRAMDLGIDADLSSVASDNEIDRLRQSFVRMAGALHEREERLRQQARFLEATNNRLAALQSITDVALSHLPLDELLAQLTERAVAATSARAGAILTWDATGGWRVRAACGMDAAEARGLFERAEADWGAWLASSGESYARMVSGHQGQRPRGPEGGGDGGSFLVLPLLAGGTAIGLAFLERRSPDAFGDDAVALMHVFAERVARAIERARAFAALEEWNEALARRVAEQQEKLLRSERLASIGLIGAGIAHELRNPLGIINNSVYYLRQRLRDADEKIARHTEIIGREVAHAARVIDSLVQFSQPTAPEAHAVDLGPVIAATLSRLDLPPGVALHVDLPDGFPRAQADEQRLGQVLENLVHNAAQAMGDHGEIRIAAAVNANAITLTVQDNGPGIPVAHRERIFEPLFSTKSSGMGLGLALCRKMIEGWGGEISVACPSEGGTVFTMRLRPAGAGVAEATR
jgi:signal transduction histidine kinase